MRVDFNILDSNDEIIGASDPRHEVLRVGRCESALREGVLIVGRKNNYEIIKVIIDTTYGSGARLMVNVKILGE